MKSQWSEYRNKKVLVTGGAGSIGGNLTRRIAELGAKEVVILDDLSSAYEWNIPNQPNVTFIKGSVLDEQCLRRVFGKKPEYVFHLAAHFANQNSVDNPETDLMVNGLGILRTLQYANLTKVKRFVYSSSGCGVYGIESRIPFKEDDVSTSLFTPYQVTKMLGELYTNFFFNLYQMPIVNARFFNVYGPGEVPGRYRNVIPNFFYWAIKKQPLPITGTGKETRDWTYVDDIVNGLLAMGIVEDAIGEAFNLGSGKEHRVIDLANKVNKLAGNDSGVTFVPSRDWDVKKRLQASIVKARRTLGYSPATDFDLGLEHVYDWFSHNEDNIDRSAEF